jgi:protein SCO1/2
MRRLYVVSVAAAAIVGIAVGVVLHGAFSGRAARADAPALPALHGQATWAPSEVRAPPFALRDQDGRRLSLAALRGRSVVLAFMDSHCTGACPLEARQLAFALRPLPAAARPRLVVVSVNLADTPGSVARAARKWQLPKGFEWLLGTHAQLAPVWRAYHIEVRPTASGDVAHSDALYVIDRNGDERAGFLMPFVPGLLTHDLRVLVREHAAA